jgi:hypothetical protein
MFQLGQDISRTISTSAQPILHMWCSQGGAPTIAISAYREVPYDRVSMNHMQLFVDMSSYCNHFLQPIVPMLWSFKRNTNTGKTVDQILIRRNDRNTVIAVVKVTLPNSATIFTTSLLPITRLTLALHLAQAMVISPMLTRFPLPVVSRLHMISANNSLQL